MDSAPTLGMLLCDDLMFASRITGTARSLGLNVRTVSTASDLARVAAESKPACVILDLANPTLKIGELVQRLRPEGPVPLVVGYGSHVDTATLAAARAAGCDVVLPRSKFVAELPDALVRWLAGRV